MTLADVSTVPVTLTYSIVIVFTLASITLLSGHGSWMIVAYNMATKKEREKMNSRQLSRKVGCGVGLFTLMLIVCVLFQSVLPIETAYAFVILTFIDLLVMAMTMRNHKEIR